MHRTKRLTALILAAVLLLLTGCSARQPSSDSEYRGINSGLSAPAADQVNMNESIYKNENTGGGFDPSGAADRKLIRNAQLGIEVKDVEQAYKDILSWLNSHGGYESSRNQRKTDAYVQIDAQLKVKPDELDALIDYAATLGEVINHVTSAQDVSETYYDTKTRLETMEKLLERYYEMLKDTRNIEETIKVQQQIDRLTTEIESMKGKLKRLDSLILEATVQLQLRQVNDPAKIRKEINWSTMSLSDMGYWMKSGLISVANVFVSLVQWLLIALVSAAPLLIFALLVILLVRFLTRKRRKARREAATKPPGSPPASGTAGP